MNLSELLRDLGLTLRLLVGAGLLIWLLAWAYGGTG